MQTVPKKWLRRIEVGLLVYLVLLVSAFSWQLYRQAPSDNTGTGHQHITETEQEASHADGTLPESETLHGHNTNKYLLIAVIAAGGVGIIYIALFALRAPDKHTKGLPHITAFIITGLVVGASTQLDNPIHGFGHAMYVIFAFVAAGAGFLPVITTVGFTFIALIIASFQHDSNMALSEGHTLEMIFVVSGFVSGLVGWVVLKRWYERPTLSKDVEAMKSVLQQERTANGLIIESIDDGVVLVDNSGIIQLFNPAASNITGWPQSDTVNLRHDSVLRWVDEKGELYSEAKNPLNRVFVEKSPVRDTTAYLKTRSDKVISADVSVSPLKAADGSIQGAVGIFRDVTQEREEEKQRAEFISTASHEMRTPVAAIEGYLALALNEKVSKIDAKARDYLDKAHQSTIHLGRLFQDLLTAAKSEDGRLSNHPTGIEMGQLLQDIVNDIHFTAEKKGLGLEYLIGSSGGVSANSGTQKVIRPLYYVSADPDRLREVVTNLFDNAIKYTDQGKITIGLTGDDKIVQFRITDTGAGIPAEDVPHLFQKFYRVDNTATRTVGGTGLGLFICRKIVELYQGRIWVESKLGEGSTFYINLPRISSDEAEKLKAEAAASSTPLTSVSTPENSSVTQPALPSAETQKGVIQ